MSYFDDVVRWHKEVGHPVAEDTGEKINIGSVALGRKLVEEEYNEFMLGLDGCSINLVADGAADLIWVVCGLCARLGIDLDAVWSEVRRANYDKVGGPVRDDGKQLKPEGWEPPNMAAVMRTSRNLKRI